MHTQISSQTVTSSPPKLRSRRFLFAAVAAIGAFLTVSFGAIASAPAAYAHDELVGYSLLPAVSPETDSSPAGFLLNFNNELTQLGAEVLATDQSGNSITEGQPELSGRDMSQKFTSNLAEGDYPISWTVVSSDGHRIAGAFTLTISENEPAALTVGELASQPTEDGATDNESEVQVNNDSATNVQDTTETDTSTAPAGLTIAAIAGGIAVFGAVIALFVRKMRQSDQGSSHTGESA